MSANLHSAGNYGEKKRTIFNGSHNALVPLYDKSSIERLGKIAALAQGIIGAEGWLLLAKPSKTIGSLLS